MQIAAIRVPIRHKAFIEREAERLLEEYLAETGSRIEGAIPVEDIAQYHLCLRLGFADLHDVLDLPRDGGGGGSASVRHPPQHGAGLAASRAENQRRNPADFDPR